MKSVWFAWPLMAVLAGVALPGYARDSEKGANLDAQSEMAPSVAQDPASAPKWESDLESTSSNWAIGKANEVDGRTGFATRYAYFEPAGWNQLPGWEQDNLSEAWAAFRRSCIVLGHKEGWKDVCARAVALGAVDDKAVRLFLQKEFSVYAIRNTDRSRDGLITGYFEPLLNGSRIRRGDFVYPIYATPDDLLILNIRSVPKELRGQPLGARIQGRTVLPVPKGTAPYVLDIGEAQADIRDKKLRLRLEGQRIVPYPIRAQIERDGLPQAHVLVWVDNPAALYLMQIQGSGKVRLPGGQVVRLAYAEQNGHPFRPPLRTGTAAKKEVVATRGFGIELPGEDEDVSGDLAWRDELMAQSQPHPGTRSRGVKLPDKIESPGTDKLPKRSEALSPEVEQLIEDLARGQRIGGGRETSPVSSGAGVSKPSRLTAPVPVSGKVKAVGQSPAQSAKTAPATAAPMDLPKPSAEMMAAISADSSYVFFREIPDGPEGPIGALGVPLTAGRSVAVDPRTTPLGVPVFVATVLPGKEGQLNRLVMAQDTGGAIRGAVRADYFWGFGDSAYMRAARMKEAGRMWVLFPRALRIAARDQAMRTRGTGAPFADVDCVVEDPDLCVEDR